MWNTADIVMANMAAFELRIISEHEFDGRTSSILNFLNTMYLTANKLPNLTYNTSSAMKVDFSNKQVETGWSAIDIGRLLISLKILGQRYAQYQEFIDRIVLRFDLCNAIDSNGNIYSGIWAGDKITRYREGSLGAKEYIARGYQAWGFGTNRTSAFEPFIKERIYGIDLLIDGKDERETKSVNSVTSYNYILDGIEFEWDNLGNPSNPDFVEIDKRYKEQAENIYKIQKTRYENDRIITARSNYQSNSSPYFVFNTVFGNGYPWNVVDGEGKYYKDKGLLSTSASFGLWVLWNESYTDEIMELVKNAFDPLSGWYEGRYEQSGSFEKTITLTTNALVLEALWFKTNGSLYGKSDIKKTYYYSTLKKSMGDLQNCFRYNRIFNTN